MAPSTRKVPGGRQATLSFNHRVTKASAPRQSAKEAALLTKTAEKEEERKTGAEADDVLKQAQAAVAEEAAHEKQDDEGEPQPAGEVAAPAAPATVARAAAELEANAVPDTQIRRYWRSIEAQSISRRVHQDGMGLGEKVLRHFDVSSQFGPCVGIARKTRWLRARRLGLTPPIEVLAVLLREEAKGAEGVQRSSFDEILNASVVA